MMVIMNSQGKFAYLSNKSWGGEKVSWVPLNQATMFPEKLRAADYSDKLFTQLISGIFIKAKEHRTITLEK